MRKEGLFNIYICMYVFGCGQGRGIFESGVVWGSFPSQGGGESRRVVRVVGSNLHKYININKRVYVHPNISHIYFALLHCCCL